MTRRADTLRPPRRILLALLVGAVVGSILTAFASLFVMIVIEGPAGNVWTGGGGLWGLVGGLVFFLLASCSAFVVWMLGLLLLGAPLWWVAHRRCWTSPREAAALGALLALSAAPSSKAYGEPLRPHS